MDNIKNCGCGTLEGISPKGTLSVSKIWRCKEHGFICPFDGWQFKTISELERHLHKQHAFMMDEDIICEGQLRYGQGTVEEALFEILYYKEVTSRNSSQG